MCKVLWVNQALDRLKERHARRNEDGEDDEETCELLTPRAAQIKRNSERHGRQRVADVVNQVRKERDTVRRDEDENLSRRHHAQHAQADGDSTHTIPRPSDRTVDEAVGMTVSMPAAVAVARARA
jgi:hypothetical protein